MSFVDMLNQFILPLVVAVVSYLAGHKELLARKPASPHPVLDTLKGLIGSATAENIDEVMRMIKAAVAAHEAPK